ncbi:DUF3048 domain-containing protein [Tuberibacillus calidus]|uniref:DUF3048 domain-containing protein n=1 Tax=Tuberibacillus calidus TaxID=340097 RepID=UPI0003FDDD88|nr:DUF3048 domain-containing protein [Tuberibacillus calidus]
MKKFLGLLGVFLAILMVAGACTTKPKEVEKKPTKTEHTPAVAQPKKEEPTVTYPLTGLPAEDGVINRRVIGVMVNNFSLARPQSGLHKADIVYEVLAEGPITRFLALFQSETPEIIGPVRSARPYFIELNNGYGAIYIAHGWSPQAKTILESGVTDYIQGLYYDGTLFKRVKFRKAPHNSYIPYENILKGEKEKGYKLTQNVEPLPFLTQDELSTIPGEPMEQVTVTYAKDNVVSYVYNPDDGLFYRKINGEQAKDRETGTPLTAANVFIVSANHRFIDGYRREIDLDSGGPAYLFQKGKWQVVEWKNVHDRILPYKDGQPVKFVPGKTWINIIDAKQGLNGAVKID